MASLDRPAADGIPIGVTALIAGTGVILGDLATQTTETIAEAHTVIATLQAQLKDAREQVDAELRKRLKERQRTSEQFGGYEISLQTAREAIWDPDETEDAMAELVQTGYLKASECVGVISRTPVVSRSAAAKLVGRLSGEPREMLEACRTWRDKGQPRIHVTRTETNPELTS